MHCITNIILNMSMLYCLVVVQINVQYSMMNYYMLLIYFFYIDQMHFITTRILSMNIILSSVDANYCTIQYDVYSRKKKCTICFYSM